MRRLPLVVVVVVLTSLLCVGVVPLEVASGQAAQSDTADSRLPSQYQLDSTTDGDAEMTNTLSIPASSIARSDVRRQHADLGPAAGFDTGETTDRLVTGALERELASVADADRDDRVDAALAEVEADIDRLETRERTAIREFSTGQTSPREFVTELAAVHLRADALRDRTDAIEQQATSLDSATVSNSRLQTIEYDLRMLEGPVRAHAVEILRGERPANRVLIETGNGGITLAVIDDGQYIREVHRTGLRGQSATELSPDRAVELVQQQYPIIWDRGTSWSSDGPGPVMLVDVDYDDGELRTFIDGRTERVFIEHQRLPLEDVVTDRTTAKVQDGLNVTAEQTYAGGPLRLTVTDAETGAPVSATVTVAQNGEESQTVGTTDENGQLWTLSPRNDFTITVLGDDTSAAFVGITPTPPERALPAG